MAKSKPKPKPKPKPQPKTKLKTDPIASVPTIKIILCGPHTVYWVAKNTKINADHFKAMLHEKELAQAKKFTAKSRKEEFLRGRWLYHKTIRNADALLPGQQGMPKWPE